MARFGAEIMDNRDARLGVDSYDNKIRFGQHTLHTKHVYDVTSGLDEEDKKAVHNLRLALAKAEVESSGLRMERHAMFFAGARAGIEAFAHAGSGEDWTREVQKAWEKLNDK